MYSGLPLPHRRFVKVSLSASWLFAAAAGLSAVILSPNTIISELGPWLTEISGWMLGTAAITAMLGVAGARYRWEWFASWFAAAALSPYLVTVWALTLTGEPTRSTQAFLVTSLLSFFITRAVLCSAHAAKLREVHGAGTGVIDLIENGGTGSDDGDDEPIDGG